MSCLPLPRPIRERRSQSHAVHPVYSAERPAGGLYSPLLDQRPMNRRLFVLVFALLFVVINLLVDLSYALLNPRLRHG